MGVALLLLSLGANVRSSTTIVAAIARRVSLARWWLCSPSRWLT